MESTSDQWIPLTEHQWMRTFDELFVLSVNKVLNKEKSHRRVYPINNSLSKRRRMCVERSQ